MRTSKKIGEACIRVLETLKTLHEGEASIQEIIKNFEKIDSSSKVYTNEVVLKYINTLKVFGCRFIKEKDKYMLLNSPYQFDFDKNDLRAICLIENFSDLLPEERVKSEINQFLQGLEKRFNDNTRFLSYSVNRLDFVGLKYDYSKYSSQIKEYEKYCIDGQRVKLTYKNKNGVEISAMVEPDEIKYVDNEVYLSAYNPVLAQIQDINFASIVKAEQLPLRFNSKSMLSSVTFKLKNDLSKVYKLKEGEKLLQINPDSTIILNQHEDRTLLLKRLMRYAENCEIISPKKLREEMKEFIRTTLGNYE